MPRPEPEWPTACRAVWQQSGHVRFAPHCGRHVIEDWQAGKALVLDAGCWSVSVAEFAAARVVIDAGVGRNLRLGDALSEIGKADRSALTDAITFV